MSAIWRIKPSWCAPIAEKAVKCSVFSMNATLEHIHETEAASDEELMAALAQGNSGHALQALYDRYRALLRSVVMRIMQDEAEADDILQDVFIQVWGRASNYSPDKGRLQAWLIVMARRRAWDRLRQRYAYRRMTTTFEEQERPFDGSRGKCHVEQEVGSNDLRDVLCQMLRKLPQEQAEAVELAFFEGRSQRDIAAYLRLPLGTVKTRIELGLSKLEKAMQGLGEIEHWVA